ncbi:MAG: DNA-processing protein DprA [Planctomycetota bacterium]
MDPQSERRAWLALASVVGVGPRTCGALVRALHGIEGVMRASRAQLAAVSGVGRVRTEAIVRGLASADPAALEREAAAVGSRIVTPVDDGYPSAVRAASDPPPALWVRGTLPPPDRPAVAVVGTRGASAYGLRIAHGIAEGLARAGVVVVSGLARGIDAAAHGGALAGGGPTVGVLGCGVDVVYPPEHTGLVAEVVANGAVLSEHPPGTSPLQGHFPRRNRIVATLSQATVVVEAGLTSGALNTARSALHEGRDVLAVPGYVDRDVHAGCHLLLREGASLCEGVDDVLRVLEGAAAAGAGAAPPPVRGPRRRRGRSWSCGTRSTAARFSTSTRSCASRASRRTRSPRRSPRSSSRRA